MEKILPSELKVSGLTEFQDIAGTFQLPQASPEERVFGLLSEAGEVAGVFQRLLRGDYKFEEATKRLFLELGDVLFYVSRIAADNNWTLQQVAEGNVEKLTSRKQRNVIIGTGDSR